MSWPSRKVLRGTQKLVAGKLLRKIHEQPGSIRKVLKNARITPILAASVFYVGNNLSSGSRGGTSRRCSAAKTFCHSNDPGSLLSQSAESKYEYHRRHATIADCMEQVTIHAKMDLRQPWHGDACRLATKEDAVEDVRVFLSSNEVASRTCRGAVATSHDVKIDNGNPRFSTVGAACSAAAPTRRRHRHPPRGRDGVDGARSHPRLLR